MSVLTINGLYKKYGEKSVLTDLNMTVPKDSIFGFVGENGAGKTTTMKIILGLLKADSGDIQVCGEKVTFGETKTNRHIGFLPDVPEFYGYMKPMEYLALCGEITGLTKKQTLLRGEELLSLVGLGGEKRKIKTFSRGMKQRLGIAQALLSEPKLLICDEPTSALDPIGRKQILDILSVVKDRTTVVFSTHILSDVEKICDHLAILHNGALALCGKLSDIKKQYSHPGFVIEFGDERDLETFVASSGIDNRNVKLAKNKNILTVTIINEVENGAFILRVLAEQNILPLKLVKLEPSLENLFTEVVK